MRSISAGDVARLGAAGANVCVCPTTERDLGDGIVPAPELAAGGCPLALGTDSHASIDPLEEARALEMDERLRSGRRVRWSPGELLDALTSGGQRSLGWTRSGRLAPGMAADLVTVGTDSVQMAGTSADPLCAVLYVATASDVRQVVVEGRTVVRDGCHVDRPDVPGDLRAAIEAVQR